ncbi:uncharacterized protein L3040_008128 [Drepanopeziza brunnea f. sp. 'multigermtubi']|uniref:uncharacterized protein n=1 Tax=Drepanopeziza brunnea f. sp. 'multigermtubi' TaxID=698441 RepID=UPI0023A2C30B|nr:hypothetical protein L3040_008128 [Drepanopeziza brunnea f. sp. 'multigermtubi']
MTVSLNSTSTFSSIDSTKHSHFTPHLIVRTERHVATMQVQQIWEHIRPVVLVICTRLVLVYQVTGLLVSPRVSLAEIFKPV